MSTDAFTLESVSPTLPVHDVAAAVRFYTRALGFVLAWEWGAPATIAAVCRDGVEFTLGLRAGATATGAAHVYLRVSDVDACHAAVERAGAQMLVPLADRDYGMRDFRFADPDGNELSVGQPIADGVGQ